MVNSVTSDTSAAAAAMKKSTGMNKDDFLKLFVTQLQNQDPLNPQDSTQFIAQLAQLTQVEQAYNTNTNLQSLMASMNSSASMTAVSFIGSEISAAGSQVNLQQGGQTQLGFRLDHNAARVKIEIADKNGTIVRTLTGGAAAAGDNILAWDGRNNLNSTLPAGIYQYRVTGLNADGSTFSGTPLVRGKVDGIRIENGQPLLSVSGTEVQLADVLTVKGVK